MTENQKRRIKQLKTYLKKIKDVEKSDVDKWFKGKKDFCVNIGAYIISIENDE